MDDTGKLNALEQGDNAHGKVFDRAAQPSLFEQFSRAPRRVKIIAGLIGAFLLYTLSGGSILGTGIAKTRYTLVKPRYLGYGGRWPGYKRLNHLVILGDSYSETGFNPDGQLPTPEDPLGNPPDHNAWTSANGPNWAVLLPTIYNQSLLRTVNLAHGGATVDQNLIPQYHPAVRSLSRQVREQFIPKFGGFSPPKDFSWKQEDTLFMLWMGINDVHNSFAWQNKSDVQYKTLATYASLVDQLYQAGGRNFLFMTIPPTDLSPITMHEGAAVQAAERGDITVWNDNVLQMAKELYARYNDVTSFVFDTHALFTQIINNPCSHPETCDYKIVDEWCPAYKNMLPQTMYMKHDDCEYSIDKYLWKDALHPTFRIHNATAKMVSQFLAAVPSR